MVDNQILVNGVMKDTKIGLIFSENEEKNPETFREISLTALE